MALEQLGWTFGEIIDVSGLVTSIRQNLERNFTDVWVEAEITDLKTPSSGHSYMVLTDGKTRIRAVCFRNTMRLLGFYPADGDRVLVRGRVTLFEQRGDLQMVVDHMEPFGDGLLKHQFELLKKKLAQEGLFDHARKKAIVGMPRKIAVVTSPTGAAVRDILNVLKRRAPWIDVSICGARVQGEGASREIVDALNIAKSLENIDVIIVGRGGGSVEDLSAFNDEALVRAIAGCAVPVISAVGHEIDFTLTDLVADLRAPTPSAAAELAVRDVGHWLTDLESQENRMAEIMHRLIARKRKSLNLVDVESHNPARIIERQRLGVDRFEQSMTRTFHRIFDSAKLSLARHEQRLEDANPLELVEDARDELVHIAQKADKVMDAKLGRCKTGLELAHQMAQKLNPLAILSRGYSVVLDENGKAVTDSAKAFVGQNVKVLLNTGKLGCEVKNIIK